MLEFEPARRALSRRSRRPPAPRGPTPHRSVATTDNGFGLLWNWNLLGAGTHTVRALVDGEVFAEHDPDRHHPGSHRRGRARDGLPPKGLSGTTDRRPTFPMRAPPPRCSGNMHSRTLSSFRTERAEAVRAGRDRCAAQPGDRDRLENPSSPAPTRVALG